MSERERERERREGRGRAEERKEIADFINGVVESPSRVRPESLCADLADGLGIPKSLVVALIVSDRFFSFSFSLRLFSSISLLSLRSD